MDINSYLLALSLFFGSLASVTVILGAAWRWVRKPLRQMMTEVSQESISPIQAHLEKIDQRLNYHLPNGDSGRLFVQLINLQTQIHDLRKDLDDLDARSR